MNSILKGVTLFSFICATLGIKIPKPENLLDTDLRLIEFNETYRQWLPFGKVLQLAGACGSDHGFFDVTDHPTLNAENAIPFSPLPSEIRLMDFNSYRSAINTENIRENILTLSNFNNRYYTSDTGVEAAHWIKAKFESYAAGRGDISVSFFPHSWKQPSVIATIKGKTQERVILGAHEDSIIMGMSVNSRAPGADDDASGTSTVLEVFRILASDPSFKPEKTVEFHTYSAEEVGLRGSQDIAAAYKAKGVPVRSMMQFDMTAYKNGRPAFINDHVNPELTKFVKTLAQSYTNVTWADSSCGYACSDHASWTRAGYPSVFPFETTFSLINPKIHTKDDLINILDIPQTGEFASLALAYILQLSAEKR